jgi:hypothetical protein
MLARSLGHSVGAAVHDEGERMATNPSATEVRSGGSQYDDADGVGWVTFAGVMMLIASLINVIFGIAAIDKANFFVADASFVVSDLATWGWVILLIGIVQLLVGLGIFARSAFARWTGVAIASINAVAQLLFLPSQPLAALAIFAIDILIIYGLIAYGGRSEASFT